MFRAIERDRVCSVAYEEVGLSSNRKAASESGDSRKRIVVPFVAATGAVLVGTVFGLIVNSAVTAQPDRDPPIHLAKKMTLAPPASEAVEDMPESFVRTVRARKGDTVAKLLRKAGARRSEAHQAIAALKRAYDPRDLLPGHEITVTFSDARDDVGRARLMALSLPKDLANLIEVRRVNGSGFAARKSKRILTRIPVRAAGKIKSNLYQAGVNRGVPPRILVEMIRIYSWDVDFQRDIQPGDAFDVMYERIHAADGEFLDYGEIRYAELNLSGQRHIVYRMPAAKGGAEYYDRKGRSAQKALMKTPIDGARLSSSYGRRRHPILGYNRMHRGVDFAGAARYPDLRRRKRHHCQSGSQRRLRQIYPNSA